MLTRNDRRLQANTLNQVRIIDLMGLFPETRGGARWISVRTYAEACDIVDEQVALGNRAHVILPITQ